MTAPNRINGRTREEFERMCANKHRWSDELSARAGAIHSLERRPHVEQLFTYQCPICRGFHLTRCWQPNKEPVMIKEACQ